MEEMTDFVETQKEMNATDLDADLDEDGIGILPFLNVTDRATFLLSPRCRRALRHP